MMVLNCPYCGHRLEKCIKHGIKSCSRCRAFFETTHTNTLLAAAWQLRRSNNVQFEQFKFFNDLSDEDADLLYKLVIEECHTHDELLKILSA